MNKYLYVFSLISILYLITGNAGAQVGINTTNPHSSAALDIQSDTRGLLIPRLDSAARVGMTNIANSLLVYDTTKKLYFYYQNGQWFALNGWTTHLTESGGNTDTITVTNSRVGIGKINPTKALDVAGDISASKTITAGTSISAPKIYGEGAVPAGAILMWSGTIATIPFGWALCDGTQGTPHLEGRFIVGYNSADPDYDATNKTGGSTTHIIDPTKLPVAPPWALTQTPHSHKGKHAVVAWQPDNAGSGGDNIGDGGDSQWRATTDNTTIATEANANVSLVNNTGGGQPVDNRAPYYVLAYIMKLPY